MTSVGKNESKNDKAYVECYITGCLRALPLPFVAGIAKGRNNLWDHQTHETHSGDGSTIPQAKGDAYII